MPGRLTVRNARQLAARAAGDAAWLACAVGDWLDAEDATAERRSARLEVVLDCASPPDLARFWRAALGYRRLFVTESLAVLVPRNASGPPLLLHAVPEPRTTKNRMHLDIIVAAIEPEIARLQELGALRVDAVPQDLAGCEWARMADPEGNEFCVSTGIPFGGSRD